jgi:anti-sigma B factor antagonist
MQTREYHEDGLQIIVIDGEIDLACSPELRAVLHVHAKARRPALALDFQGVSYVDSSGLATLVEYVRKTQAFGGRFALVQVSDRVRTIFDLVRLGEFLPIYATIADAKAALIAPPGA